MRSRRPPYLIGALLLLTGIGCVVLWLLTQHTPAPPVTIINFPEEKRKILRIFEKEGDVAAYTYLKEAYTEVHTQSSHAMAHLVGRELFKRHGWDGVSHCDEVYEYGCYHGFFAQSIVEEGTSHLTDIEQACLRLKKETVIWKCFHGVGHGLLSQLGVTPSGLSQALTHCSSFHDGYYQDGCGDGVFMEYTITNSHEAVEESQRVYRALDEEDPHAPCNLYPRYETVCYNHQIVLWELKWGADANRLVSLCSEIAIGQAQNNCYQYIAQKLINDDQYDIPATVKLCALFPPGIGHKLCIESALRTHLFKKTPDAYNLCDVYTKDSEREDCIEYGKIYLCNAFKQCS
jgi:hypothetical protein